MTGMLGGVNYRHFLHILRVQPQTWVKVSLKNLANILDNCRILNCRFVWVWNFVVDIAGGKEAEGVWEHGVEENIWT